MSYFAATILAFVEGLTEFLPISSTGHLIIVSALMGINEEGFVKDFNIIIQAGAILSVIFLYWRRFLVWGAEGRKFYLQIFVAFLPAAVIGLLVKKKIDLILGSVSIVAWALIIGGLVLIWADRYLDRRPKEKEKSISQLTLIDALKIGLIQCFAFIPGVSRAGATILGGVALGLNKKEAAEFSFFLAVPTLMGAATIKGASAIERIQPDQIGVLIFGVVLAFIFATIAIRIFIRLLGWAGFKTFGYYRVLVGVLILALY
jgi:undecaprenyl-diphosphatase